MEPQDNSMIPEIEILCEIGRGAAGTVFLARKNDGCYCAVKTVSRAEAGDAAFDRELHGGMEY